MPQGIVLFYTIHDLFCLEAELRKRGIKARPVPTPRELSSDCGSALSVDPADLAAVRAAVSDLALDVQGIHTLES